MNGMAGAAKKILWNSAALLCVGVGTVGIFVPGLPTTVFYIIALYGFTVGGNDKARARMLDHPRFGASLRQWEETKAIPIRIKWIACSSIIAMSALSSFAVHKPLAWAGIWTFAAIGLVYIVTRPTLKALLTPSEKSESQPLAS